MFKFPLVSFCRCDVICHSADGYFCYFAPSLPVRVIGLFFLLLFFPLPFVSTFLRSTFRQSLHLSCGLAFCNLPVSFSQFYDRLYYQEKLDRYYNLHIPGQHSGIDYTVWGGLISYNYHLPSRNSTINYRFIVHEDWISAVSLISPTEILSIGTTNSFGRDRSCYNSHLERHSDDHNDMVEAIRPGN